MNGPGEVALIANAAAGAGTIGRPLADADTVRALMAGHAV